jgi:predicted phosphoribosyltransferase
VHLIDAAQRLDAVAPYANAVVRLQSPIEFRAMEQIYRSITQVEH